MKRHGFTLVEVLLVIVVMAIVLTIATLNFPSMLGKANTEKQAGEILSKITTTRLNAMQKKQRSLLMLGPNQFTYKTYSSDNDGVGTTVNTTSYFSEIKRKNAINGTLTTLNIASDRIEFDSRGFTNNTTTLVVTPVTYGGGLNCIVVQMARTSIGRMVDALTCQKQ